MPKIFKIFKNVRGRPNYSNVVPTLNSTMLYVLVNTEFVVAFNKVT